MKSLILLLKMTNTSQTIPYPQSVLCRPFTENFLSVKFEEIMLYLINKYGDRFELYLHSLISKKSPHSKVLESNIHSNLKLEEIAFMHMSIPVLSVIL
jgi:hypothetical protein